MNKLFLFGLLIAAAECQASITFSLDPSPQSVSLGSEATFTLDVAGLGGGTALGTYDLTLTFDPTVLSYDNVTFGTGLDPDGFGPVQFVFPGSQTVELFEISVDPDADLLALQPDAFTLATIVFDTLGTAAESAVTLSESSIGDQDGNDISGESVLNNGSVTVTAASGAETPEPATIVLLLAGLLGMACCRKNGARDGRSRDQQRLSD